MVSVVAVTGDPNNILQKSHCILGVHSYLPLITCQLIIACALVKSYYLLSIRKLIIWSEKLSVLNDLLKSTRPSFLLLFCGFAWFRSWTIYWSGSGP